MKGLLEFENVINFVQFEKLRVYFFEFIEKSVIDIIESEGKNCGPMSQRIEKVKGLEKFFFDTDLQNGIWDTVYRPSEVMTVCEK